MAYDTTRLLTVGHARQVYENLAEQIASKADLNGSYDELTVGSANQLVSRVGVTNKSPYVFRPAGDSNDIGDRKSVKKLIGGTLMWNQLLEHGNFDSTTGITAHGGTVTVANNVASFKVTSASSGLTYVGLELTGLSIPANHVLLVSVEWQLPDGINHGVTVQTRASGAVNSKPFTNLLSGRFNRLSWLVKSSAIVTSVYAGQGMGDLPSPYSGSKHDSVRRFMIFDLTMMFGSDIADSLYASSNIDWFTKRFPADYYSYNSGEAMSVNVQEHKTVGFNAWDEQWEVGGIDTSTGEDTVNIDRIRSKNYISVLPNTTYYANSAGTLIYITEYDENQNHCRSISVRNGTFTTSAFCKFIRFMTTNEYGAVYHDDICINISWDGERNGDYESYAEHRYLFDSSVTLLGIPKVDDNDNVYYDGDIYEPDGTITRRYGIVTLDGSEEWTKETNLNRACFKTAQDDLIHQPTDYTGSIRCNKLKTAFSHIHLTANNQFAISGYRDSTNTYPANNWIYVRPNDTITEVADLKTWLASNPLTVVYELAEPYEDYATPYYEVQVVDNYGTERFLDSRTVQVPVGHESVYLSNLRAKLESAPNSPSSDGNYVVQKANGTSSYVPLSSALSGTTSRITALEGETVAVEGTTPSITCIANGRYTCGTVTSISITPCAQGVCEVIFTSGSTPATLTIPSTVKFPQWFNKASLESNTIYEISILDGFLATVGVWPNT